MSSFDPTNRGSIWKNERKTKDTHPDFTGSINVEGREYFFDAWKRKDGAGPKAPALTFKVKPKDAQPEGHPDRFQKPNGGREEIVNGLRQPRGSNYPNMDDDVPF